MFSHHTKPQSIEVHPDVRDGIAYVIYLLRKRKLQKEYLRDLPSPLARGGTGIVDLSKQHRSDNQPQWITDIGASGIEPHGSSTSLNETVPVAWMIPMTIPQGLHLKPR